MIRVVANHLGRTGVIDGDVRAVVPLDARKWVVPRSEILVVRIGRGRIDADVARQSRISSIDCPKQALRRTLQWSERF